MRIYKRRKSSFYWLDCRVNGKRRRCSLETEDCQQAVIRAETKLADLSVKAVCGVDTVAHSAAIMSYLRHGESNGLARSTLRIYKARLIRFLQFVGDVNVREWDEEKAYELVRDFLALRVESGEVTDPKWDRIGLSGLFNYLRAMRWYRGENPANSTLHLRRRARKGLKIPRRTTPAEDVTIRRECSRLELWPVVLLARWAGLRRGEACTLRWKHVDFTDGYADIVGEEGGRKHPRRVWLAPWIVLQLRTIKAERKPLSGELTVWPYCIDTASKQWVAFCSAHLNRKVGFNDLRASWVTEVYSLGMTAQEEAKIGGHSPAVADRYYSDFTAQGARDKLPSDPLGVSSRKAVRANMAH